MGNFARTVRVALRYRWTVGFSAVCALVVASLWGGNIGVLLPLIEVVANNQSLGQWVDEGIGESQQSIAKHADAEGKLEQELKQAPPQRAAAIRRELGPIVSRRDAAQADLDRFQRLKPWIDAYLPNDPFRTLVVHRGAAAGGHDHQRHVSDVEHRFWSTGWPTWPRSTCASSSIAARCGWTWPRFNESGTSDLLSRFTYDIENVAGGIQTLFGRAVREPLKMIACLVGAAYICWQLLLLSLIVAPVAGFLIALLAKTLKRANRKALEEMSSLYTILAETFTRHQGRQSVHHGTPRTPPLPRDQQEMLPQGDADRAVRRPDQSRHRSDGHLDDLPGDRWSAPTW